MQTHKDKLNPPKAELYAYAALKGKEPAALTSVDNANKGLTAEPNGVDEHLRQACDPIVNQPDPDEPQAIRNVLKVAQTDGPEGSSHHLPPLDGSTLMTTAAHTKTKSTPPVR